MARLKMKHCKVVIMLRDSVRHSPRQSLVRLQAAKQLRMLRRVY